MRNLYRGRCDHYMHHGGVHACDGCCTPATAQEILDAMRFVTLNRDLKPTRLTVKTPL